MKLISACLAGINCRYDGNNNFLEEAERLLCRGEAIPVCPEQFGGFSTPRPPAEIKESNGDQVLKGEARVINSIGEDVTGGFLLGAKETLKLARMVKAEGIILKENSPSCGVNNIYDGTFSNNLVAGEGVTAALLRQKGFWVISDRSWFSEERK